MVVFLLKLIFLTMTFISNMVSRLIFSATAHLLVLLIHGFSVPGQAIYGASQQVAQLIKSCSEHFMDLVMEATIVLISAFFDFLKGGVTGSASVTTLAIGGLIEKTKASFDGLLTDFPEIFEGFSEMVATMVMDLWNNIKDAFGYVTENA